MRIIRVVVVAGVVAALSGCGGERSVGPTSPELAVQAARRVEVSGTFDALVDFSTLSLTPRGRNCLLEVSGRLVFHGTIEGVGTGRTSALVSAPCDVVATTPPGTFSDVFKSELVFEGTIDGEPARANVLYMGGVEPGGHISGRLVFSNGVQGRLNVEAQVAVGGEYKGAVVVN
jgi:hypothetical protein